MNLRPLTPKEFSAAIGGTRSPRWVRAECEKFLEAKKRARRSGRAVAPGDLPGLEVVNAGAPYLISPRALERFRPSLADFAVA